MNFKDLEVWKRSARLSANLYRELAGMKDYGFRDQITRSALSVPSNIAEGFERGSNKEFVRFLYIAKGSCGERETRILISMDIGYINTENGRRWAGEAREVSAMLGGLINKWREAPGGQGLFYGDYRC